MSKARPTSVPIAEAIRRLRLFNEKAALLERRSFYQKVFGPEHSITMHFAASQPLTVEHHGPDDEATEAMSLTFRFFFNRRDHISLDDMRELYQELPIPDEEKARAQTAFDRYDGFLKSPIGVNFMGTNLTNWDIIETVLYGDLAHVNADKEPKYRAWREAAPFDSMVRFLYEDAVAKIIEFILDCHDFNEGIIKHLEEMSVGTAQSTSPKP